MTSRSWTWLWLVLLLLAGGGMRAALVLNPALGHDSDLGFFSSWSRGLAEHGLQGFFAKFRFCDYPPLSVLILWTVGKTASLWPGGLADEALLRMLGKVPACLADVVIALALFAEGRRLFGARAGLAAAALFFLNPVPIYNSAYWGQVDSIYTAFALLALLAIGRTRWHLAGATAAAGLLAKFQTIALLPLLIFEVYRLGGWRGLGRMALAAVAVAALVLAPFIWTGTSREVLQRAYVHVVGQYNELSKGAYNLWYLFGAPETSDTGLPPVVVRAAAQGRVAVPAGESWLMSLTWRRVSLALYALVVAVVLSVYSLRPGPVARFGAMALLGFAFFLFPTEMHERYAFPTLAFLALWAVSASVRERVFWLVTVMLLLNLAAILPANVLAHYIGAANVALFAVLLVLLPRAAPAQAARPPLPVEPVTGPRRLIPLFRWATVGGFAAALALGGWIGARAYNAPPLPRDPRVIYLSTLRPVKVEQRWGTLRNNYSVAGGMLELGRTVYLRGLGTHAPSKLTYNVPENAERFRALVGITDTTEGAGSAVVNIELDGVRVYQSSLLRGGKAPEVVDISVADGERLVLTAEPTPDGQRADHVDWALARFE